MNANINKIPTKNIWWFLAVYKIGIQRVQIKDVSNYYHCQSNLYQYFDKGEYDTNEYENEEQCNFIWLLQNPVLNQQNNARINNIFNEMLSGYDWNSTFSISGYRLK